MTEDQQDKPVKDVQWHGNTAVVQAVGDINIYSSADFQDSLRPVLARKPERIVIDMTGVDYMDSSGIASLVKILSRAKKIGTRLRLAGLNDRTRGLLEITRLDTVFELCPTVGQALE